MFIPLKMVSIGIDPYPISWWLTPQALRLDPLNVSGDLWLSVMGPGTWESPQFQSANYLQTRKLHGLTSASLDARQAGKDPQNLLYINGQSDIWANHNLQHPGNMFLFLGLVGVVWLHKLKPLMIRKLRAKSPTIFCLRVSVSFFMIRISNMYK